MNLGGRLSSLLLRLFPLGFQATGCVVGKAAAGIDLYSIVQFFCVGEKGAGWSVVFDCFLTLKVRFRFLSGDGCTVNGKGKIQFDSS
mmetsp:Transcript_27228/g.53483  ORF Transcript_27228/g.53483 Transcript_27228/m.53483 type:complete len:87 (-) Transcript_27228:177-437(-)